MRDRRDERYYRAWMTHRHVSRRGLLRGLLGGGRQAQRQAALISECRAAGRPPYALAEAAFLACCDGCGECVDACPYGLIALHEGHAWLDIAFCACDTQRCRACVDACPTGALQPWLPADTAWRPQVGPHCLGRYAACRLCQRACPQQALCFDDAGQPQLEESACDGCGQCKIACHDGHLQLVAAVARGRG
ncbi:4Fe-4S dicluster domain-containing protein [Edwardsiella piscicida]|uniref:4Fe-4S dicluster domain-containing protein n=1 Tax=Edwardsiella piscicida TaxID=1263550 RepID=UPI000934BA2C|nr:4Fe-4S dicluster domain-containing protein [Edwardsiella piscicida]EKS7814556.1 4Fe-4S binding protein [Edwardsiella piscicida]UCQ19911.1 4Fe-4S binding protein [Edwardsiella piscicida]WAM43409.1 4Fe-4S binding protein [Edwardsiella piscicida]